MLLLLLLLVKVHKKIHSGLVFIGVTFYESANPAFAVIKINTPYNKLLHLNKLQMKTQGKFIHNVFQNTLAH